MSSIAEAVTLTVPSFTGQLLRPADDLYDGRRRVHNGLIDRRPALIASCQGVADVVDAVHLARTAGLEVSVRAQGGVLWRELNRETQLHGLATTGGVVGSTGIAGLTLGGGLGSSSPPSGSDAAVVAYGPNLARLREIKTKYDPENVFRHNVNILPR